MNVTTVGGTCGTAAGDLATITVAIAGASSQSGPATCTAGAWTRTLTTPLTVNGAYTATATQNDNLGNVGTSGSQAITVDKTAPVVTLTSVNGTPRTFPFTTSETITTVGGACGTASGDSTTVNVTITGARDPTTATQTAPRAPGPAHSTPR